MATAVVAPLDLRSLLSFPSVTFLALSGSFRPSLHPRYRTSSLLRRLPTSPPLSRKRSPQVRYRICLLVPSGSTGCVSDDVWASLFPANRPGCPAQRAPRPGTPPAPGLTAGSCSYGRKFAARFFQLRLTATPCVSLRLPSSAPVGSFHPTRFCPCWAHGGGLSARARPSGLAMAGLKDRPLEFGL